jgi:hypothetical protein
LQPERTQLQPHAVLDDACDMFRTPEYVDYVDPFTGSEARDGCVEIRCDGNAIPRRQHWIDGQNAVAEALHRTRHPMTRPCGVV